MKKTFLAKRNALLSSDRASWGSVALGFVAIVLVLRFLLPNVFWYVVTPVFAASTGMGNATHGLFSVFSDKASLMQANELLTSQNVLLSAEVAGLTEKDSVLSGASLTGRILAGVVSRPPESPYDTFLVAAGKSEGVTPLMEAFAVDPNTSGGVPIGIVSNVTAHYSQITLFSAPRITINGWIGKTAIPVTLHGTGGGTFGAVVSRSAAIGAGDIVYVSGPGMLPIGTIARVDSDPSSPAVVLRITPLINIFSIGWVTLRDSGANFKTATTSFP